MHCESFPLRKLCSSLALSSRDGSQVSAPCGSGGSAPCGSWWLKSWGSWSWRRNSRQVFPFIMLHPLISNLAVNPLLVMSSSMEVDVVNVEVGVSEASSSLSPIFEELLELVT